MKITLKEKKLADGRISLYIESFKGSTVDEKTGKRVHLRDFEFLKLYLHPNPKTARQQIKLKWSKNKEFCPTCRGTGRIQEMVVDNIAKKVLFFTDASCPDCKGSEAADDKN